MVSWTAQTTPAGASATWVYIAMSASGQYQAAVVYGGTIYTSITPYSTISVSNQLSVTGSLITQGLVYETTNSISGYATNSFSISYGTGGIFWLPTASSITANMSIIVTNIPTDITKSYTFTVAYYQASTRWYINQVRLSDTAATYILGTSSTFGTPYYNGGPPALTGTTACIFLQQFTVFSFGSTRYVITSVSASTTT